jgi:hypothetical protein
MIYNITISILSMGLLSILYFVQLFIRQCILLKKFKGPFAIPFVGNCYSPDALFLLRYLGKLRKRFGKIFTFFAFQKPYLVVCDPNVVRRVLSDTKTYIKGIFINDFKLIYL